MAKMAKKKVKMESMEQWSRGCWEHEFAGKALMSFMNNLQQGGEDAVINCLENGLSVVTVDPSHVMMLEVKIGDGEEVGLSFGADVRILKEALTGYTKLNKKETQMVTMKYNDTTGKILFDFGDNNFYELRALDKSTLTRKIPLPEIDFPIEIVLNELECRKLLLSCNKQRLVGDLITFIATKSEFRMETTGSARKWTSVFDREVNITDEEKNGNMYQSQYSMRYILSVLKQWKGTKEIRIEFGNNFPLKMTTKNEVGGVMVESMTFLAPRIENDN